MLPVPEYSWQLAAIDDSALTQAARMSCHAITVVRNEVFRVRKNGGGSYITALDLVSNFLTDFNAARTNPGWRLPVGWLLLAAIIGCGPPLTDPSSKNMSGIW